MSKPNDGGPAFPLKEPLSTDATGMSLRDYFAAMVMAGFVNNGASIRNVSAEQISEFAYEQADAMMKARQS
jgi:hypothetical protein